MLTMFIPMGRHAVCATAVFCHHYEKEKACGINIMHDKEEGCMHKTTTVPVKTNNLFPANQRVRWAWPCAFLQTGVIRVLGFARLPFPGHFHRGPWLCGHRRGLLLTHGASVCMIWVLLREGGKAGETDGLCTSCRWEFFHHYYYYHHFAEKRGEEIFSVEQ